MKNAPKLGRFYHNGRLGQADTQLPVQEPYNACGNNDVGLAACSGAAPSAAAEPTVFVPITGTPQALLRLAFANGEPAGEPELVAKDALWPAVSAAGRRAGWVILWSPLWK